VKFFRPAFLLILCAIGLRAQEEGAELTPIVVTGTFELRRGPSAADSFTKYLEREIDLKHAAEDEAARAPLWHARFWSYIPFRIEPASNDSTQFFTPSYLNLDYREAGRSLEESRKHSLFDAR